MDTPPLPVVAITLGDPAGVGPEIVLRAVRDRHLLTGCRPLVIGHPEILLRAAKLIDVAEPSLALCSELPESRAALLSLQNASPDSIPVVNPCDASVTDAPPREVSAHSGQAAFDCLRCATQLALNGIIDGIATAPLNKEALHTSGYHSPGHTEILADQCGVTDVAMMLHLPEARVTPLRLLARTTVDSDPLVGHGLSIAHVTLHTSIASVPQQLSTDGIVATVRLMDEFLTRLRSERRAIAVAALNPHGGEHGLFGDEESRIIEPAVRASQQHGWNVSGPLPVDTLIRRAVQGEFDGVVAMYHDQGHIPIKLIGFDSAINITLGLPIIRTSPTHGTAFDRAWNAQTPADPSGMIESIRMAAQLAALRSRADCDA